MSTVETRKTEIRYRTTDLSRMRNRFIARRVMKTRTEECLDTSTGKMVEVECNELLFEKGTFIDDDVLTSIRFWQVEGSLDGKEIEVSNQRRLSFVERNSSLYPYKAAAKINDRKWSFLLYATSVANALIILTDYIELNFDGGFTVTDIKEMDYYIILIDSLKTPKKNRLETDIAYLNGDISVDEYADATSAESGEDEEVDNSLKLKFYQITSRIVGTDNDGCEETQNGSFIVQTYTAARANLIIGKWLQDQEQRRYLEAQKNPDRTYEPRQVESFIEKSKTIPIGRFIPVEFSQAYQDDNDDAR